MYKILLKNDASVQFYILFNIVEADPQLLFELDLAWLRMSEEKESFNGHKENFCWQEDAK